ncbi:MAG TPA: leucyl aminopeptidase [Vicinamibacterales bacterium]|nr:leucyl aminopeptidase [Vicinamibacterales bacterium]
MARTAYNSSIAFRSAAPAEIDTDLLILPVFEDEDVAGAVPGLAAATGGAVERAAETREIPGRPYELFLTPVTTSGWRARRLGLIGCGKEHEFTTERLRRVATAAALGARQRHVPRLAFVHRGGLELPPALQAITEGLLLAAFSGDGYKSRDRGGPPPEQLQVVAPPGSAGQAALERAVERGRILGESSNIARQLCNEPSNVLTPAEFAVRAAAIARDVGLGVDILEEDEIAQLKMGLLLGVARGSAEPPRVIAIEHMPAGAPSSPVLGLVGKGITFDTGGISIKPADGMDRMKDDMAGGAAVVAALRAIALLDAPIRVIGVVPATENMPDGRAIKPGDVLTGAGGTTVEVLNTDAEGRLILGDALWYARQRGATHLVDVATLTGACVVALGRAASAVFGEPDPWVEIVRQTALAAGDRCWPMPLFDDYSEQLKSEIADLVNTGGRPAGACTAAMFLKEFAGGLPWAHLDIAGTAWAEEARPWQPKGATGVAVRTLAELAFTSAKWKLGTDRAPAGSNK